MARSSQVCYQLPGATCPGGWGPHRQKPPARCSSHSAWSLCPQSLAAVAPCHYQEAHWDFKVLKSVPLPEPGGRRGKGPFSARQVMEQQLSTSAEVTGLDFFLPRPRKTTLVAGDGPTLFTSFAHLCACPFSALVWAPLLKHLNDCLLLRDYQKPSSSRWPMRSPCL